MAGVVGQDQAIYTYSSGWVLDTDNRDWLEIPPRPAARAIYAETVTAAGSRMIVFGGQSWAGDDGRLLNETWVWPLLVPIGSA